MKTDIASYIAFQHENYEFKKGVVALAKAQPKTFEGRHTSVLMYVNIVDYIAYHLIENLSIITYLVSHYELNGIIYFNGEKSSELPLGTKIGILKKFEFPDKTSFISDLQDFIKLRNKYIHGLLMLKPDEVSKIDSEFIELAKIAERLINTYDTIVRGVTETWKSYLQKLAIRNGVLPTTPSTTVPPSPTTPATTPKQSEPAVQPTQTAVENKRDTKKQEKKKKKK